MMRNFFIQLGLILLFTLTCSVETNLACFVGSPSDHLKDRRGYNYFVKDYNRTIAIFTGKVVELDQFKVKFKVDKIWKGNISSEFIMSAGAVPTVNIPNGFTFDCDYQFELGKTYLVYAQQHFVSDFMFDKFYGEIVPEYKNLLWASKTSRTRQLKDAKLGIENLNKLNKPKKAKN
ncbi:MAG: hypothetical protein ACR2L1_04085 [Pyrinomonadaceae bacterium]